MTAFIRTFWNLLVEMAPWLLLGFLFAGILKVFVSESFLSKKLAGKGILPIIRSVLIGIPLPLCSCGVIPTAVALHKKGASKASVNGFLIATPQTGIDSILATYSMLGLPFAIVRPVVALLSGVFGGWFTSLWVKESPKEGINSNEDNLQNYSAVDKLKQVFQYGFFTLVQDIVKWLFIGLILATIITIWVPQNFFSRFSNYPLLEFVFILTFSIPLYVCATGSIPIGLSLLMKGISPGAVLVFLMAGPATNITTLMVMNQVLGKRATLSYLFSIIFSSVIFGLLLNKLLPSTNALEHCTVYDASERSLFYQVAAGILLALMFLNAWTKYKPKFHSRTMHNLTIFQKTFLVEGMTCNHCKNSVEKHLRSLKCVKKVEVELATGKMIVEGTCPEETIKQKVEELGYTFKGELKP